MNPLSPDDALALQRLIKRYFLLESMADERGIATAIEDLHENNINVVAIAVAVEKDRAILRSLRRLLEWYESPQGIETFDICRAIEARGISLRALRVIDGVRVNIPLFGELLP